MSIKKLLLVAAASLVIIGFIALGVYGVVHTNQKIQFNQLQLKSKTTEIQELNVKYDKLNIDLDKAAHEKNLNQADVKRLEQEKADLEKQKADLEAKLQAKIEAKSALAMASSRVINAATNTRSVGASSGNCYQWLLDAGVADMASAVELQSRENRGCNPQLYNQGGSDACGVAQELPCGKSGCGIPPNADGACQIRWMNGYVLSRYGSWTLALAHHDAVNWY